MQKRRSLSSKGDGKEIIDRVYCLRAKTGNGSVAGLKHCALSHQEGEKGVRRPARGGRVEVSRPCGFVKEECTGES